jgi:hypothetical protein
MKSAVPWLGLAAIFTGTAAFAQGTPCDQIKGEIEAKLKAKGVTAYKLDVVPADQAKDQKVVGSCEGGRKKIVYSRERSK